MSLPLVVISSTEGTRGNSKKIVDALKSSDKITTRVENIGNAIDFLIPTENKLYGIQRKKVTEMGGKASLIDVQEMLLIDGMKPFLLLEGDWKSLEYTRFAKNMIIKRLYQICQECEVNIIPSGNVGYTIKWLLYIATHVGVNREIDLRSFRHGIPGNARLAELRKSVKEGSITKQEYIEKSNPIIDDAGIYFLTGLPGISKTLATRLIQKYESPISAINNYDRWKEDVVGFGGKKTSLAKRVLEKKHIKIESISNVEDSS